MRTMTRRLITAFVLLMVASPALAAAGDPADRDRRAVMAAFADAQAVLAAGKGTSAVPMLSRSTRDRLEIIRAEAVAGDPRGNAALGPTDKFAALGLRLHLTPSQLRRMSISDLANQALARRWLGPNVIRGSRIDSVRLDGDRATARLLVNDAPAPLPVEFRREGGTWKIDLTNVAAAGDQMLRLAAITSKRSENETIATILENLSGRPVGP